MQTRTLLVAVITTFLCSILSAAVVANSSPDVFAGTGSATAAPTPATPGVRQQPEGNTLNVIPFIPAANLWICEEGPCSGPGEGTLRVVEQAFGVAGGLGAYELIIAFDHTVVQSVNPCDLVFGPGGAGAARGP